MNLFRYLIIIGDDVMSHKKHESLIFDRYDSYILYFSIIAIIVSMFIVRVKVLVNQLNFDMLIVPYRTNLFTHYKLVWLIFVVAVVLLLLIYKMFKEKQKISLDFILLGTGLIIISTIIATIISRITPLNIWGLYSRSNGLLAYISLFLIICLIANLKVQIKHITLAVHIVNIASMILVLIGILQFFGLDIMNSVWYKQIYIPSEYSSAIQNIDFTQNKFKGTEYYWASSLFGQFNYFGAYCSIIFPFLTAFALNEKKLLKKALLILGSIMLFVGTILAQSMGSILAMFATLILIPIFLMNKHNYKSFLLMIVGYTIASAVINKLTKYIAFSEIYKILIQIINSKFVGLAASVLVIYLLLFIFRKKIAKYRFILVSISIILVLFIGAIGFNYILNNVVEQNMGMLSGRGYIWHYSHGLIKDNYILGYGPDSFYYYFPQINIDGEIYLPNTFVDKPHNMYLQVWIDTGIFGLIGFMTLLVGLLLKSNKAIDVEEDLYKKTYFKALMLLIAAYMIQGIVNDNHMTIQPTVYLIFGIGASLIKQTLDKAKLSAPKK
jgi:hypothetical protein